MRVVSIRRYPVKSMMGEELNACEITEKGLIGDRAFAVIDVETGKVVNAKSPNKWAGMFRHYAYFTEMPTTFQMHPPVHITLPNGEIVKSSDKNIGDKLTESIGRRVLFARPFGFSMEFVGDVPEETKRLQDFEAVFTHNLPENTFFDSGMVHVMTTSTMKTLQKFAPTSRIEARRFRPNLVIDTPGVDGFIEDNWIGKTISIGNDVQLKITKHTKRCVMTTLAQGDLPKEPNILRVLAQENEANFGVYAEIVSTGKVLVGDTVQI